MCLVIAILFFGHLLWHCCFCNSLLYDQSFAKLLLFLVLLLALFCALAPILQYIMDNYKRLILICFVDSLFFLYSINMRHFIY